MEKLLSVSELLRKANLDQLFLKVIKENEQKSIDLNVDDQLYEKGILATGKTIGEYAPFTIAAKQKKGQRYDHITLRDTSNFHDSFFLDADKWPVFFDARDSKTPELLGRYGDDIFGLTDENKERFAQLVKEDLQKAFRSVLGL